MPPHAIKWTIFAGVYGQTVTLATQLAVIPILLHEWGLSLFGIWVMLSSVPAMLALADLGLATAAGNEMTMQVARGNHQEAIRAFSTGVLIVSFLSILIVAVAGYFLFGCRIVGDEAAEWPESTYTTLALLLLYVAVSLFGGIVTAIYRSIGKLAAGLAIYDTSRLAESIFVISIVLVGGRLVAAALVMFIARAFGVLVAFVYARRSAKWLHFRLDLASIRQARYLMPSALAAMALPGALAISLQGMVLVVGALLSPSDAGVFGVVRTICRAAVQFTAIVGRSAGPAFSVAYVRRQQEHAISIVRMVTRSILLLLLPLCLILGVVGTDIVRFWTGGQATPSRSFVALMSMDSLLHGVWFGYSYLLLAINEHCSYSYVFFIVSVLALGGAWVSVPALGLDGAAAALIFVDAVTLVFVLRSFKRVRAKA